MEETPTLPWSLLCIGYAISLIRLTMTTFFVDSSLSILKTFNPVAVVLDQLTGATVIALNFTAFCLVYFSLRAKFLERRNKTRC